MATCLYRNISPDLITTCAGACSDGNWSVCAVCLNVGASILLACGIECYLTE
jgi:hypothetical protein